MQINQSADVHFKSHHTLELLSDSGTTPYTYNQSSRIKKPSELCEGLTILVSSGPIWKSAMTSVVMMSSFCAIMKE